jgi:hypothetical protein
MQVSSRSVEQRVGSLGIGSQSRCCRLPRAAPCWFRLRPGTILDRYGYPMSAKFVSIGRDTFPERSLPQRSLQPGTWMQDNSDLLDPKYWKNGTKVAPVQGIDPAAGQELYGPYVQ